MAVLKYRDQDGQWRTIGGGRSSEVAGKVSKDALKAAFTDPSATVKMSTASIKAYLQSIYNAIQAI